jgi:hypothetical protein
LLSLPDVLEVAFLSGLYDEPVPLCVGVNTGFDGTTGFGATAGADEALPAEYLAPEASATFRAILSGVRSRSDRAVIWTWYPWGC